MKYLPLSICVIFLAFNNIVDATPKLLNGIKATVNGEPITQNDVDEAVKIQIGEMARRGEFNNGVAQAEWRVKQIEEKALNDLIDRKLILSEFKTRGGKIGDEFIDNAVNDVVNSNFGGDRAKFLTSLSDRGMSLNQFRKTQEERIAVRALQGQLSRPGDDWVLPFEKDAIYDEIKHEYQGQATVRMQMLTVPKLKPGRTKQQQKELIYKLHGKIAGGTPFSSIAREYSFDQFAPSGGFVVVNGKRDLNPNSFNPKISKQLNTLALERVSPVIEDGLSWRLVMVNRRSSGSIPSKKELDPVLENRLLAKKRRASMEGWLAKLRRDSNVQINY